MSPVLVWARYVVSVDWAATRVQVRCDNLVAACHPSQRRAKTLIAMECVGTGLCPVHTTVSDQCPADVI